MELRKYNEDDVLAMIQIWNEVVEEGVAFPQVDYLMKKVGIYFLKNKVIVV